MYYLFLRATLAILAVSSIILIVLKIFKIIDCAWIVPFIPIMIPAICVISIIIWFTCIDINDIQPDRE